MHLEEGQIYEGNISISGEDGPFRRWLVVAPFGKKHIHSVDDPLELHCWPVALVEMGVKSGRLRYVGKAEDHPAIKVQRIKEQLGVRDAHLSISERCLELLLEALRDGVESDADYAPYLAGEIRAAVSRSIHLIGRSEQIFETVMKLLGGTALAMVPSMLYGMEPAEHSALSS